MESEVTCPRCQKTFATPPESEGVWRFCPYCHELNPGALRADKGDSEGTRHPGVALLGGLMIMLGVFVGAACGFPIMNGGELIGAGSPVLGIIWILGGLALVFGGIRVIKTAMTTTGTDVWNQCADAWVIAALGICAWIFVFATCASGGF